MSFAKASKKEEDIKQSGGAHINKSGIYPVNIIAPLVDVSNKGSTVVNLYVDHSKQKQVIYGNLRITNNDGSSNVIGAKIFNQLMIIADVENVDEPIDAELPIGKKESMKDCAVLEDLADVDVLLRIQLEYGAYSGNITEKKVIKGFYRAEDSATAEEIVNGKDFGNGYAHDQKYVNNITYKDGVTPEQIEAWISAKRPKGTAGNTAATGDVIAKKPIFGKKVQPSTDSE